MPLRLRKMRTLPLQSLMLPRYLLKALDSHSISPFIWLFITSNTPWGNTYTRAGVWWSYWYWKLSYCCWHPDCWFSSKHTTDGKKIIYIFYPSAITMSSRSSLTFADTNVESSEPIQPDIIGASSAVPSLQIEAATEKVLYPLHRSLIINWSNLPNQDFLIYRHSIFYLWAILSILRSI